MRYVEVQFRPTGKRYTYHHDGPELIEADVDRVEILTRDGPGTFKVLAVHDRKPAYETKPITKVLERPPTPPSAA